MQVKNLDCFFSRAKQHVVCQDYALSGTLPQPFLILCDGCSSSQHSDVGARLLAMGAKKFLTAHGSNLASSPSSYHDMGLAIIHTARKAAEQLGLEISALDATLLLAFPREEGIQVYAYGDGYIAAIGRSDELQYKRISFRENMPYYLNYWTDEKRRSLYLQHNQQKKNALRLERITETEQQKEILAYDAALSFIFSPEDYALVALLSDGMAAMSSITENRLLPEREVLKQLLIYKTTKGGFVQRRARRFLKNCNKQDIYPTDDLSLAVMLLEDNGVVE